MTKKLILFSGGLDSTVLLHELSDVTALIFDYGQKASKEIECALDFCRKNKIHYELIDISGLFGQITKNTLIDDDIYDLNPFSADIPCRNSIFIEIATAYALTYRYDEIYIGLIKSEQVYSEDTTPMFLDKINELNRHNNRKYIPIKAPYINLTKEDIIKKALELNIQIKDTWSCFYNEKEPCGVCDSCITLKKAMERLS